MLNNLCFWKRHSPIASNRLSILQSMKSEKNVSYLYCPQKKILITGLVCRTHARQLKYYFINSTITWSWWWVDDSNLYLWKFSEQGSEEIHLYDYILFPRLAIRRNETNLRKSCVTFNIAAAVRPTMHIKVMTWTLRMSLFSVVAP